MDFESLAKGLLGGGDNNSNDKKDDDGFDLGDLLGGASMGAVTKAISDGDLNLDDAKNIMKIFSGLTNKEEKKPEAVAQLADKKDTDNLPDALDAIKVFINMAKESPELLSSIMSVLPKVLSIINKK